MGTTITISASCVMHHKRIILLHCCSSQMHFLDSMWILENKVCLYLCCLFHTMYTCGCHIYNNEKPLAPGTAYCHRQSRSNQKKRTFIIQVSQGALNLHTFYWKTSSESLFPSDSNWHHIEPVTPLVLFKALFCTESLRNSGNGLSKSLEILSLVTSLEI